MGSPSALPLSASSAQVEGVARGGGRGGRGARFPGSSYGGVARGGGCGDHGARFPGSSCVGVAVVEGAASAALAS